MLDELPVQERHISSLPNKKGSSQCPVGKGVISASGWRTNHLGVFLEKESSRRPVGKGAISASGRKGVLLIEVFSTAKVYFSEELYMALYKNNYCIKRYKAIPKHILWQC